MEKYSSLCHRYTPLPKLVESILDTFRKEIFNLQTPYLLMLDSRMQIIRSSIEAIMKWTPEFRWASSKPQKLQIYISLLPNRDSRKEPMANDVTNVICYVLRQNYEHTSKLFLSPRMFCTYRNLNYIGHFCLFS